MRRQPDRTRLALALGASALLHLVLLWPGSATAPQGGIIAPGRTDGKLTAVLPGDMARGLTPPATTAAPLPEPQPAPTPDARGHYASAQISRPPRPLAAVDLNLPEARLLTAPGRLLLKLWIDAEGVVVAFEVDAPDLPEEYATAVAEAFSAARFAPGELLGRKVPSVLKLEILHEAGSSNAR
jgi:hypothetical protein